MQKKYNYCETHRFHLWLAKKYSMDFFQNFQNLEVYDLSEQRVLKRNKFKSVKALCAEPMKEATCVA